MTQEHFFNLTSGGCELIVNIFNSQIILEH